MTIEDILDDEFDDTLKSKEDSYLKDKTVLLTGAGGSIGQKLAQVLLKSQVKRLILADNSEVNLFNLQQMLILNDFKSFDVELLDVCCEQTTNNVFKKHKPSIVYHAAAYKHVPMLENFPYQAFKVNVIGTKNIIDNAVKYKVKKFVLISTDKAVYPQSVMGVTKRMAELYVSQYITIKGLGLKTVRFGNIPNTTGSVLPSWKNQLKTNKQIKLVNKKMFRYFISLNQVCKILIDIIEEDKGSLFISNMGEAVSIDSLAKMFLKRSNNSNELIKYIDKRAGEKIEERLMYPEEFITTREGSNYSLGYLKTDIKGIHKLNKLIENYNDLNYDEFKNTFKTIIPEYSFV